MNKKQTVIVDLLSEGNKNLLVSLDNGNQYECFSGHTEVLKKPWVRILSMDANKEYLRPTYLRTDSIVSIEANKEYLRPTYLRTDSIVSIEEVGKPIKRQR